MAETSKGSFPDIQNMFERLVELEKQNRKLKRMVAAMLLALCALAAAGVVIHKSGTIRAEDFQLVDSHGKLMGRMRVDGKNPELELYNQHGASAVALYAFDSGNSGQLLLSSISSGVTAKTSANSIVMTMPDGRVLWRAPLPKATDSDSSR